MEEVKEEIKEVSTKAWVYRGEESKLVEEEDIQRYYNDNWGDTPGFTGKMAAKPITEMQACPTCGHEREVEVESVSVDDEIVDKGSPELDEVAPVVDEVAKVRTAKEEVDPLDSMTKAQLLEEAKKYSIAPDSQAKKADIIRIIKSCQGEAPKKKAS